MPETAEVARVTPVASLRTYTPAGLRTLLGPAEAQYAQDLTLAMTGDHGPIACGTTIVDQGSEDSDLDIGDISVQFAWNDLAGESGYRVQWDTDSATYATEDFASEVAANSVTVWFSAKGAPGSTTSHTGRAFGHIGHAADHGAQPISGDVVSNECTVTFQFPET